MTRRRNWWHRDHHLGNDWLRLGVYPSSINLPRLHWLWETETDLLLWADWGNGNTDPVWSLDLRIRLPRKVADWLADRGVG